MNTEAFTAVLPVATLVLGAGLTFLVQEYSRRHAHAEDRSDALRSQRASAYQVFIRDGHEAAHLMGRTSEGCTEPLSGVAAESCALRAWDALITRRSSVRIRPPLPRNKRSEAH